MSTASISASLPLDQEPSAASTSWLTMLPALLRTLGAAAVLLSLYSFLFLGWTGSNDLVRYAMLLAHTGLLAVVALASGHFFKEGKGPRLLLVLSLVAVPVNFAILGAFILSASPAAQLGNYPPYVAWVVPQLSTALGTTALAILLLIPVVLISFRALARGMSRHMSALYLLSNLALLPPLREPRLVAALAIALGLYTLCISAKSARQRTEARTREGMMALMLQFLPVSVLLGRSLWLYSVDMLLLLGVSVMGFIALRHCARMLGEQKLLRSALEVLSVATACLSGWLFFAVALDGGIELAVARLLGCLLASAMSYDVAHRAAIGAGAYRGIAVLVLLGGVLCNLLGDGGMAASLLTIVCGVALITFSYLVRQRLVFLGGALMVCAGLADQVAHIVQWFDFGYWAGLAAIGMIAIVLASLLESKGPALKQAAVLQLRRYGEWDY